METILAELAADPGVAGLVGGRIFAQTIQQGAAMPAVALTIISDVPIATLDGSANTRLRNVRVQADSYAARYLDAHAVASAVENVLANLSRHDLSGVRENNEDIYDDVSRLYRVSSDYLMML